MTAIHVGVITGRVPPCDGCKSGDEKRRTPSNTPSAFRLEFWTLDVFLCRDCMVALRAARAGGAE